MNKKFKVGDIVVLVDGRYLSTLGMILAEKKHLFEVESVEYDRVDLKSTSTGLKTTVYEGNLRHATLKEQYLRDGNSIVFDGKGYLVLGDIVVGLENGFHTTNYFNDDLLTIPNRSSITKVFYNPSGKFENKIDENHEFTIVLWENKPRIELTSDEIVILKNIDKKYKYIVRDGGNNGSLFVYETEPMTSAIYNEYFTSGDTDFEYLSSFNHLFKNITFESGPHLINDLIKGNEKMKEKVIDTYYWLGYLGNYEVKGFIYNEDTEILTLYTYTDDEKDIKTIVDLSYVCSPIQLETLTDEEINEHLLETYEEYVHYEDLVSASKGNEK